MLLIITSIEDVTADLVVEQLEKEKISFLRFNTEEYPLSSEISVDINDASFSGLLKIANTEVSFHDINTVWFRKPGAWGISPEITKAEAQCFAIKESEALMSGLYASLDHAFWVSRPEVIKRANNKIFQLKLAQKLGFKIPRTLVTNSPVSAKLFCETGNSMKIIKPMSSGQIACSDGNIELIYTSFVESDDILNLNQVSLAPCLFQEYIPKEYELRITVIGRKLYVVGLDSQSSNVSRHDWRRNNCDGVKYFKTSLPGNIEHLILEFVDYYGLAFSAFDFIKTTQGEYVFLENNPNGQWAWLDLEIENGMIEYMAKYLGNKTPR